MTRQDENAFARAAALTPALGARPGYARINRELIAQRTGLALHEAKARRPCGRMFL